MDYKSCVVCFELFNEDSKCPRMLTCGHSFCHSCLVNLLALRSNNCPNCKCDILYTEVESIPVNYSLKHSLRITARDELRWGIGKLMSEGCCAGDDYIEELLHKSSVVEDALFQELKERVSLELEIKMREGIIRQERWTELIGEAKRKDHLFADQSIVNWWISLERLERLKSGENKLCENMRQIQSSVENSTSLSDFLKTKNELHSSLQVRKNKKLSRLEELKNACQNGSLFAWEHRYSGGLRFGKVAVKEGRIRVYNFQLEKPDSELVCFYELQSRHSDSILVPKTTFLELTPKGGEGEKIEVTIETDGVSQRSLNFILLCSGLLGSTYKGMTFDSFVPKSLCGMRNGPSPVVCKMRCGDGESTVKEGGVYGMEEDNSWFVIPLNDESSFSFPIFGVVTSGLQNLKNLKGEYEVTNCGIML